MMRPSALVIAIMRSSPSQCGHFGRCGLPEFAVQNLRCHALECNALECSGASGAMHLKEGIGLLNADFRKPLRPHIFHIKLQKSLCFSHFCMNECEVIAGLPSAERDR